MAGKRGHRRWIIVRKAVQASALVAFVGFFIASRRGGLAGEMRNVFIQLDPLTTIANLFAARALPPGWYLAMGTILFTLVFGRAWCGWLCPLGTLIDLFSPRNRDQWFRIPESWRTVKFFLAILILFTAAFTGLTLLVIDPLTLLYRFFTTGLWPALDRAATALESFLFRLPAAAGMVDAIDAVIRPALLPDLPISYTNSAWIWLLMVALLALNWVAPRFWCRYLCPLGGFTGLLGKFALVRRQVDTRCCSCGACSAHCPTGTIDPDRSYASDPAECTLCLDCLPACSRSYVRFDARLTPAVKRPYDPNRRTVLAGLATGIVVAAALETGASAARKQPFLLRPPGSQPGSFLSTCVRCAACLRACPTGALQPALAESGLSGLAAPLLVPRLGYCDYSCNACGQVCPVGAIPRLTLDEKRQVVIGKAYIDQNRCIAWADHTDCIVCEEMCPLSDKAILLEERNEVLPDGSRLSVRVPIVLRERCVGCGICEYKCPAGGEAAIRVHVQNTSAGGG